MHHGLSRPSSMVNYVVLLSRYNNVILLTLSIPCKDVHEIIITFLRLLGNYDVIYYQLYSFNL